MIQARMTTVSASWATSGSEAGRGHKLTVRAGLLASAATLCLGGAAAAQSLPTGGSVAHGDVSIAQPGANAMTITQGTNSAVVNWQSFSIGSDAHVDIRQPDTNASMLNRVTGSTTSEIHGRLTANGQVHLVNPNGIFIGPNGTVDAGAFVASTLDISDQDFVAGRLSYRGLGNSATVENAGRVSIGRGGYAALLGGRVRNSGVVTVPMGKIAFGSGERAVLDLSGDQFLQVAVPTGGEDGDEALIENSGLASAQGGLIEMRAATAREAVRQAVNLSGVAEARSVSVRNGAIVLGGGAGGTVNVTGRVSTRSEPSALIIDESPRPPKGPEITITGQRIQLAGAEIDASGEGGGGLIRIGGDFAGAGDLPRADEVFVDDATTIRADALGAGDGGRVAIWSDVRTDYAGYGSVRGGDTGGDGGFFEVSSRETLRYAGLTDRRAPLGKAGMLLLDPRDIIVNAGAGAENEVDIEGDLELGDVTLNTSDAAGNLQSEPGDITINADLDWNAATTLFLLADNNIAINGSITALAGGLDVDANGTITAVGDITVDSFFLSDGSWEQFDTTADFSANDFHINQFSSSFARTAGGDGDVTPFQIFDIYGLQGIGTYGGPFVLINDIDGSGTVNWTPFSSTGFEPIEGFGGTLDGAGFTVSNLFQDIEIEGPGPTGFFDFLDADATVTNLTLANADFTGSNGGILAVENQGSVSNTRVSGTITAEDGNTGGMVGVNSGTIEDSIADVAVNFASSGGTDSIGGFVGLNSFGLINRSHALGDVTVTNSTQGANIAAGGFVGEENSFFGTINDSYAQGDVTVTSNVGPEPVIFAGGFVGFLDGTINRTYSSGLVTVNGDPTSFEGGWAGAVDTGGDGTGNFWDTQTSGQGTSAFGDPLTTAQFQDTATFISIAEAEGWDFETTWAPGDTGFYPVNYSTSTVVFAVPDDITDVQYGLTPGAATTGSVFGGPGDYVFDEDGDALDTSDVFQDLNFETGETVGLQTFTLSTTSLTSSDGLDYRVVDLPATANVTPAPLTIIADDDTKTYGEAFTPTNFTVSGTLFFSDSVDTVDLESDGAAANAPVDPGEGSYSIFVGEGGATGTGLDNYDISFLNGTLTIDRAPLTITPNDQTKTFGTTFEFTGTEFTTSGFAVAGDGISDIFLVSEGAPSEAQPGNYPILISGFNGTGLENYDITAEEGTMTVQAGPDIVPRPPVVITIGLPNPTDTFDDGFTVDIVGGTGGPIERQRAAETLAKVQDISGALEIAANACAESSGDVTRYLACLSDALDDFASELDVISLDLPPGMENVAQIIQTARQQIDGAATRAASRLANATTEAERQAIRREAGIEARAALDNASNEIRKAITLVRAEDPELASLQRATITTVANAVDSVGIELTRVTDL